MQRLDRRKIMWTALDVFIGLTLCYALVSLICTVIQEFMAQLFDSRGKLLREALSKIKLDSLIKDLGESASANPGGLSKLPGAGAIMKSLASDPESTVDDANAKPHWIERIFRPRFTHNLDAKSMAIGAISHFNLLSDGDAKLKTDAQIKDLKLPKPLELRLLALSSDARKSVETINREVAAWSEEFLGNVAHWFTRRAQIWSLVIGMAMAFALNVDTIKIANALYSNDAAREAAVAVAKKYTADGKLEGCPDPLAPTPVGNAAQADQKLKDWQVKVQKCMTAVKGAYPIPLGWDWEATVNSGSFWQNLCNLWRKFWGLSFLQIVGLLISGFALSLGSRFWFDLLKSLVSLRTGGQAATGEPKAQQK
jgi:hypothetical protein